MFLFPSTGPALPNEGITYLDNYWYVLEFLFPSNGKAFLNSRQQDCLCPADGRVSIPFHREGVSEQSAKVYYGPKKRGKFLFPSNGTAFLNLTKWYNSGKLLNVSIPFNRDGVSELTWSTYAWSSASTSFYSLQTGRHFRTDVSALATKASFVFLFPSNGKAFPNQMMDFAMRHDESLFLFPSNGTAFPNGTLLTASTLCRHLCFYSLQAGRRFRTDVSALAAKASFVFLFPSNGKAFPNLNQDASERHHDDVSIPFKRDGVSKQETIRTMNRKYFERFYSLQTGRRF